MAELLEKNYDTIIKPVITEKSTSQSENNQVSFIVNKYSTKPEIKNSVEAIFGVKVESVNTIKTKGKVKRFRGYTGKRNDYKKAIINLKEGETIDITSGVK